MGLTVVAGLAFTTGAALTVGAGAALTTGFTSVFGLGATAVVVFVLGDIILGICRSLSLDDFPESIAGFATVTVFFVSVGGFLALVAGPSPRPGVVASNARPAATASAGIRWNF